jgi:hypothetical protein
MKELKTKSIKDIEQKMINIDSESTRGRILENAKGFKTSWISLGQALYTVWKDKLYKEWGYESFETYTAKEIGIRKQTAIKLLRSYSFLEKEGPLYLKKDYNVGTDTATVPTYESVNVLRLASNKKDLSRQDYSTIKKGVLEMGKDALSAKRDITSFMRQREELEPEEAWQKRKITLVKRFLSTLKSLIQEAKSSNMISAQSLKDTDKLVTRLETEIS